LQTKRICTLGSSEVKGWNLISGKDGELSKLLEAAQEGNKDAYKKFLVEVSVLLEAFLVKRMNDSQMVEDVLQDSLLAIHRARHTYLPDRPVGPWLYAICRHRMMDHYRKCRRRERIESFCESDATCFGLSADARETNRETDNSGESALDLLDQVSQKQRQVIELLKMGDLSVREVSAQTGMSESAVKVTAFRGYEAIRRFLGIGGK
jgi:RNA polymerase sigma-70 factor (ECF subfamily)